MSIDAIGESDVALEGLTGPMDDTAFAEKAGSTDTKVQNLRHHIIVDGRENGSLLNRYVKEDESNSVWDPIRRYVRDAYFLPLNSGFSYADALTESYTAKIVKTLKGVRTELSDLPMYKILKNHIQIREVPIDITFGKLTYRFNVRVVESKPNVKGKKFRFVNFSWYANNVIKDGKVLPWSPRHIDEMSVAPLDVLRALKQNGYKFETMMCFSLGNLAFNGLKDLSEEEFDLLPKNLLLNRGFTSLWKVLSKFYTGISSIWKAPLFQFCSMLRMNPDSETELKNYVGRIKQVDGDDSRLKDLSIYALEATGDLYFSGVSGLDGNFAETLKEMGVGHAERKEVYAPGIGNHSQHFISLDRCVTRGASSDDSHYSSLRPVASVLAEEIFFNSVGDDGYHSCFVVSGNRNPPDTIIAQMIPLYNAFLAEREKFPEKRTYGDMLWEFYGFVKRVLDIEDTPENSQPKEKIAAAG